MKRSIVLFIAGIFCCLHVSAQRSAEALQKDSTTLQERFYIMKDKSETFQDYKVIKGYVLDGVWKITTDSINAQKAAIREANASIKKLQDQVATVQATIDQKDATISDLEYDGTHIKVLGIDMLKSAFISTVGIVILALLVLVGIMLARMRWIQRAMKEKADIANGLSNEFEEYKRKALDKQMKLSRELQDQRNKLQELGNT